MIRVTFEVLAVVTLHWTNPSFQADDICGPNLSAPVHLTQTLIQYARVGGDGVPRTLRTHSATAGALDTIMVPDTPAATYFVTPANALGLSTCQAASYTVGVPAVGVGPGLMQGLSRTIWDIAGRKLLAETAPPGVFFQVTVGPGGRVVRRIVVIR